MKQSAIFAVLADQIGRDKERLIRRLNRMIEWDGGCALWVGATGCKNGYGRINFKYGGRHVQFSAHAVFMTLMLKSPIPDDKEVDHLCSNRKCVRHLALVTRQENLRTRDERRKEKDVTGRGR